MCKFANGLDVIKTLYHSMHDISLNIIGIICKHNNWENTTKNARQANLPNNIHQTNSDYL